MSSYQSKDLWTEMYLDPGEVLFQILGTNSALPKYQRYSRGTVAAALIDQSYTTKELQGEQSLVRPADATGKHRKAMGA